MGLGPPVCMKCRLVMSHDSKRERHAWYCEECGANPRDNPDITDSLFMLSHEDAEEIEIKSYGEFWSKKWRQ